MKATVYDLGVAGRFRMFQHGVGVALQVSGILWTWETVRTFHDDQICRKFLFVYAMRVSEKFLSSELKVPTTVWQALLDEERITATKLINSAILPCNGCSRFTNGLCSAKLARPKRGTCKMRKGKI